jgi:membrane protease subunit HflK
VNKKKAKKSEPFKADMKFAVRACMIFFWIVVCLLCAVYGFSGLFSVSQNEIVVQERFGVIVNDRVVPGMHYALPWPIDVIHKVPVKTVKRIKIADFSGALDYDNKYIQAHSLPLYCITGDNNIVNLSCGIQYSISDPSNFLYSTDDAERIMYEVASRTLVHHVGSIPVEDALTTGKKEIEIAIQRSVQKELDRLGIGLNISFVELTQIAPPQNVQRYFDDVINARIDKRKKVSDAEAYRNQKLPEAKADAYRIKRQAESYARDVVTKAQGESQRFLDQLSEYRKKKGIIKKQMYLDALERVFESAEKLYILSNDGETSPAKIKLIQGQ